MKIKDSKSENQHFTDTRPDESGHIWGVRLRQGQEAPLKAVLSENPSNY
jgi:hypothetical protein